MPKLPVISGAKAIKAFSRAGWRVARQKGSHVQMVKEGHEAILTVPIHSELRHGTLRGLIRDAGLTVEEFVDLL